MKLGEVVWGGVWIASAVKVAGYSWNAYTGTYSAFGGPGSAPTAVPGGLSQASGQRLGEGLIQKIPLIGKPLESASQWLGSLLGTEPNLNPQQIARLQNLPAPPTRVVNNLKKYLSPDGYNQHLADKTLQQLVQWAHANGYRNSDIKAYLTYAIPGYG